MLKVSWMVVALVLASTPAVAQNAALTSTPPNIIVPNYNGIPIGPLGGLEGSAYIARAGDTSAPWFNPAGLSQAGTQLSGSVGNYQFSTVVPKRLPNNGGSTQHLPNLVGATGKWKHFTGGFALITTIAWGSDLDSLYTFTNADGNPERFAYSAASSMVQRVTAGAVGYDFGNKWRVGGGIALTSTSITSNQIISDRINTPDGNRTLLFASRASGSLDALRGVFGLQVEPTSMIRIGLVTRTSGLKYGRSGTLAVDSTLDGGGPSTGASVYDGSAAFEYKLPYELSGGIAVVGKRAQLEFDIKGFSSVEPYALLSSTQPLTIYTDPGDGTRGTNTDRPFPPVMTSARRVTNFTGGGHVQILDSPLPLTVHGGIGTDHSPVPAEDNSVFGKVDFLVLTAGISGSLGKFSFAFGVNSRRGDAQNLVLQNLITGPVQASLQIKTIGITYSLNYKF
jgi:hypothetical protein